MRRLSYSILASAVLLTNTSITSANEFNFDYFGKTSNTPSDLDLSSFIEKDLNTGFTRDNGYLYTINSETK